MQRQMEMVKNLLQLIEENPNLPVIPMVYMEALVGDCGCWVGKIDEIKMGETFSTNYSVDAVFTKTDDFNRKYDALEYILGERVVENMEDFEIEKRYSELPWRKSILVYIERP